MTELRRKYRTPQDAMRVLGLDPKLLSAKGMALDGLNEESRRSAGRLEGGGAGDRRRQGRDEGELRAELQHLLEQVVPEQHLQDALALLDECLLGGDRYGDFDRDGEDEEFEERGERRHAVETDRRRTRDELPRSGVAGGVGGRLREREETDDRRDAGERDPYGRGARDRHHRRVAHDMAMDRADAERRRVNAWFGLDRIKQG
jgi:hypothetical protein